MFWLLWQSFDAVLILTATEVRRRIKKNKNKTRHKTKQSGKAFTCLRTNCATRRATEGVELYVFQNNQQQLRGAVSDRRIEESCAHRLHFYASLVRLGVNAAGFGLFFLFIYPCKIWISFKRRENTTSVFTVLSTIKWSKHTPAGVCGTSGARKKKFPTWERVDGAQCVLGLLFVDI